jgi:hypothetical protein
MSVIRRIENGTTTYKDAKLIWILLLLFGVGGIILGSTLW